MKLLELKVCPKCGYIRKDQERAPAYECPHCGIIYGKYRPPAPAPEPPPTAAIPQAKPSIKPETTPNRKAARGAAPVLPATATAVDALLLSVAVGVLLEPVFGLTRLLKRLGVPGDGPLSGVLGGRFFMIDVGVAGTLFSIVLVAVILFALGAHRGVRLSGGRKVVIAVLAINYVVTMRTMHSPLSMLGSLVSDNDNWIGAQDATLSLTMVVFGVLVTQHLIEWSRLLQVYDAPEGSA